MGPMFKSSNWRNGELFSLVGILARLHPLARCITLMKAMRRNMSLVRINCPPQYCKCDFIPLILSLTILFKNTQTKRFTPKQLNWVNSCSSAVVHLTLTITWYLLGFQIAPQAQNFHLSSAVFIMFYFLFSQF